MKFMPSLNALRAFEAVVRRGSVAAAANALHVTPGAVSKQIRSLEAQMGIVLLVRDGRGVHPTSAGKRLQHGLASAFAEIAGCVDRVTEERTRDQITIYTAPMFALTWLIPRIDRFADLNPEIDIAIKDVWSCVDTIPPDADLIIDYGRPDGDNGLVAEKLTEEEIFPVCSEELGRRIAEKGCLEGITLLHPLGMPRAAYWPGWAGFGAAVGLENIDTCKGLHFSSALIQEAARAGKGLLLSCSAVAHDDLCAKRLVRPIAESMNNECGYWLLAAEARLGKRHIAAFHDWLLEELSICFDSRGHSSVSSAPPSCFRLSSVLGTLAE